MLWIIRTKPKAIFVQKPNLDSSGEDTAQAPPAHAPTYARASRYGVNTEVDAKPGRVI